MARSHWIIGACPALLAVIVAACGGGDDAADTDNNTPEAGVTPAPAPTGSDAATEAAAPPVTDAPLDADAAGTVSETSINFGSVNCGSTAAPKTFAINNPSTKGSMRFEVILNKNDASPFVISPLSGTIQPGQRQIITVTPYTIPRGTVANPTTTVANGQGDAVTVSAGTANLSVELVQRANGAIVNFATDGIDFKSSPIANTASPITQSYNIQNSGSVPASLKMTVGGTGPFGLFDSVGTKTETIAANIGNSSGTAIFRPTVASTFTGTVAMELANDVPLCADLPEALTLKGRGVNSTVQLSQGQLDFGLTPCGNIAQPKNFTITNLGNAPIKITSLVVTQNANLYGVASSTGSNQFAPNATSIVTVTPRAIGQSGTLSFDPATYKGILTIITKDDVNNVELVQTVDLLQTMQGAFLTRTPASVAFGQQPRGSVSQLVQTYANIGNQDVVINVAKEGGLSQFTLDKAQIVLPKNGSVPLNVQFIPTADQGITDYITVTKDASTASVPWCHQTAAAITKATVTGSGRTPTITATPASLDFLAVNCGSTTDARTIVFTNNGPAGHYKAAMKTGAQYTLSGAPLEADIAQFGTVTFTVTPLAVPTTNANMNAIVDQVTFTLLDAPGGNTISTLSPNASITPRGAFVSWLRASDNAGISALTFNNTKVGVTSTAQKVSFRNTGTANMIASFEWALDPLASQSFTTNGVNGVNDLAINTPAPSFDLNFKPTALGLVQGKLVPRVTTDGIPLCNTQAALTLNGTGN